MANVDSEDELKRRMRRRLVGAVALVTAMVVILPMLLESTPKRPENGLELRIPDKEGVGRFTSQMVVAESAPEITPLAASGTPPEMSVEQAAEPPARAAAEPVSAVPAVPAKPDQPGKPAHQAAKPEHQAAKSEHQPGKPEHKAAESAHAAAPKAGFAVQVGAFANAATAKELAGKLRKQGWHAYTEKAGETVRVRVGRYATREAAEHARRKLAEHGLHPDVVSAP